MESKGKTKTKKPVASLELGKIAFGIFLILLAFACLASPGTHLYGFAYVFVFLFGWFGMYLLCAYAAFMGICFILNRFVHVAKGRISLGFLFILLGSVFLAAHLGNGGTESTASVRIFFENFNAANANLGRTLAYEPTLAGGYIGYLAGGFFLDTLGLWFHYVVSSFLIVLGALLIAFSLLRGLVEIGMENRRRRKAAIEKEKDRREKEAKLDEIRREKEKERTPFIDPEDIDNSFFEGREGDDWNSPLDRFRFTPAGSNPVPSSMEISESRGRRSPIVDPAYNPKEIRGVSIDMNAPVTKIGLQEAVFQPKQGEEKLSDHSGIEAESLSSAVEKPAEPASFGESKPSSGLTESPFGTMFSEAPSGMLRTPTYRPYNSSSIDSPVKEAVPPFANEPEPAVSATPVKEEAPAPTPAPSRTNPYENIAPNIVPPQEEESVEPVPETKPTPRPSFSREYNPFPGLSETNEPKKAEPVAEPEEEEEELDPVKILKNLEPRQETVVSTERAVAREVSATSSTPVPPVAEEEDGEEEKIVEPTPAPRPVIEPKPAPAPAVNPAPRPEPTPASRPQPAVEPIRPEPAPAPAPQPAPVRPAPAPAPKPVVEEKKEEGPQFVQPKAKPLPKYVAPKAELLKVYEDEIDMAKVESVCCQRAAAIDKKFADMRIGAHVAGYTVGPSVTRFDIETDPDVSVNSITRYMKDISKILGGVATRFAEIVPGKTTSAIEVVNNNEDRRMVSFKECFEGLPSGAKYNMAIPFGVNIENQLVYGDLSKFPHMLVAGTTGSGKSIFIQGILMSLIMRNRPEEVKLMLVDPKRVEFSKYRDIPHLLCPIIKEAKEARVALGKLCDEMDRRYGLFEAAEVSDIREFNADYCEPNGLEKLPFIVLVVDEYADLVEQEKDVGSSVLRLTAKARACGIHLIICTQRPDVKVITGTIKTNLNTRVALHLKTEIDSRTILNQPGAEELLDHGDMLVDCDKISREFLRLQGCMVNNHEISRVTNHIREQFPVVYHPFFADLSDPEEKAREAAAAAASNPSANLKEDSFEAVYEYVRDEIMAMDSTSISRIQRQFKVGYPRASEIFNRLIEDGIVAPKTDAPNSSRPCEVICHSLDELNGRSPTPKGPGSLSSSYVSGVDPYGSDDGGDY